MIHEADSAICYAYAIDSLILDYDQGRHAKAPPAFSARIYPLVELAPPRSMPSGRLPRDGHSVTLSLHLLSLPNTIVLVSSR